MRRLYIIITPLWKHRSMRFVNQLSRSAKCANIRYYNRKNVFYPIDIMHKNVSISIESCVKMQVWKFCIFQLRRQRGTEISIWKEQESPSNCWTSFTDFRKEYSSGGHTYHSWWDTGMHWSFKLPKIFLGKCRWTSFRYCRKSAGYTSCDT